MVTMGLGIKKRYSEYRKNTMASERQYTFPWYFGLIAYIMNANRKGKRK